MADDDTIDSEIRDGSSYRLADFMRRTGLKERAIAAARSKGLATVQVGTKTYILGSDWHAFLAQAKSGASAGVEQAEGGFGGVRALDEFAPKTLEPKTNTNEARIRETGAPTETPADEKNRTTPALSLHNDRTKPTERKKRPRSGSDVVVIPEVLQTPAFLAKWDEWIGYRKKRKLTCLDITLQKQLDHDLVPHGAEGATDRLEFAMRKGWQGIYPTDEEKQRQRDQQRQQHPQQRRGIAPEAMAQFREDS